MRRLGTRGGGRVGLKKMKERGEKGRQEREMRGESCTDRKGGDATCSEKAMQAGPHRGGAKSF